AHPNFRFIGGAHISEVRREGHALRAVQAGGEWIAADRFVLALGAESVEFVRLLDLRLPLYPLKGYSITVPLEDEASRT
ncbi:FAD-dependent oxidoreductase, partial [Klebsiella pneumoniae]|uniref:FAD-dependent oxidoreductase n=3 Tax=Pseudomonadota TaxID=1224 RepID=UPI0027654241|nr:hypothetical protein [Klebsiella pneumoniae]